MSWPIGESVNAGIDKNMYLGSQFDLNFPSVDHITEEAKRVGRGALLYKVDVSRAFRHVKVDPGDYDLLGLQWNGTYMDTCLPFGTRHGSQIFQRISDAVRYMMHQEGFCIIDDIDDYVGVGVPSIAHASYHSLLNLMGRLGLSVSQKKLVPPSTRATCLGVLIDTDAGTISIPPEKLLQINETVQQWLTKRSCTKRQLQSLLGLLLYIHKCVKPARVFLNPCWNSSEVPMVVSSSALRQIFDATFSGSQSSYHPTMASIIMITENIMIHVIELDACLTGLGGCVGRFVYHLPLEKGYKQCGLVQLEMVNILLAMRLFWRLWSTKKILVRCDNHAVVTVLRSGKARDPFLAACARNIWYCAATYDIDVSFTHIPGTENKVADLLSRWKGSTQDWDHLLHWVPHPWWVSVNEDMLSFYPDL